MTKQELHDYLMGFAGVRFDYPFGEHLAAYKAGGADKMFALIAEDTAPLRVSLRTDPVLNKTLQERYESVLPGENLNKKQWMTVICTGQLGDDDIKDLARLSYRLVTE